LEEHGYDLERIDVGHVDVYFQHITHRLSRMTLRNVATGLRAWFRFCEAQGWTQPGLADAILLPRIEALTQHSCHQPQTHRRSGCRLARTTRVAERLHGDAGAWAEP
jgi:hypothetical protein